MTFKVWEGWQRECWGCCRVVFTACLWDQNFSVFCNANYHSVSSAREGREPTACLVFEGLKQRAGRHWGEEQHGMAAPRPKKGWGIPEVAEIGRSLSKGAIFINIMIQKKKKKKLVAKKLFEVLAVWHLRLPCCQCWRYSSVPWLKRKLNMTLGLWLLVPP